MTIISNYISSVVLNPCSEFGESMILIEWVPSKTHEFSQNRCNLKGKHLIKIGRYDPTSKKCSCGVINDSLKLSDREWTCDSCNITHDRDILAANNIKEFSKAWATPLKDHKV